MTRSTDPQRVTKTSRKRGCAVGVAVLALALGFYAWMFFSDVGPGDDSDLRLPPGPVVAPADNAAHWLGHASEGLDEILLSGFEDEPWFGDFTIGRDGVDDASFQALESLVTENRARFDTLHRAASCETYSTEVGLEAFPTIWLLNKLIILGAQHARLSGDRARAWDLLAADRSLLRLAARHPDQNMASWLWQNELQLTSLRRWLIETETSPLALRRMLASHDSPPILPDDWAIRMVKTEYTIAARWFLQPEIVHDLLDAMGSSNRFDPLCYRPRRTLSRFASSCRERLALATADEVTPPPDDPPGWITRVGRTIGGNRVGEVALEAVRMSPQDYVVERRQTLAIDALLQVAIALRIHRCEQGVYPAKLETLVPELLPEIPTDPFDRRGGKLRWDPTRRVLWSIGENGTDEKGQVANDGIGSSSIRAVDAMLALPK